MSELRKILFVEDDPDIRAITVLALESIGGFEVKACASGREALQEAPAFQPDLLLLDVMMPGMDGLETLAALRKTPELKQTPAAFMTAKVQPAEIEKLVSLQVIEVLAKPFDPLELPNSLREAWRRRRPYGD